jgi:ABC-type antimicrobial peptide transport system permease subunit
MSQAVRETMGAERFSMVMVGMASGIAVLLAGVGVFGVMANLVLERHRDIAVRLALGSSHRRMFNLILRTGFQLGVAGCAMGVIVSFSASRFMGRLLFEVSPNDVVTYVLVGIGVLVLSVTAGLLPARRASRIPLVDVLSGE